MESKDPTLQGTLFGFGPNQKDRPEFLKQFSCVVMPYSANPSSKCIIALRILQIFSIKPFSCLHPIFSWLGSFYPRHFSLSNVSRFTRLEAVASLIYLFAAISFSV
jgi:hypothetical protein